MFGFACILSVLGNPARRQITARSRTLFYKGGSTMKVTVLMENTAPAGCALAPEHGLSFWIETGEQTILLDACSRYCCICGSRSFVAQFST